MITPRRTLIRHYIKNMLLDEVDVGGRVFVGRPNAPLFIETLPAVNIHFGEEPADVNVGDRYHVKDHIKKLETVVTVVVENQLELNEDPYETNRGEDFLDYLSAQVEYAFNDDWMLARRLPNFDPNTNYTGLASGIRLLGTLTYDVESEATRTCIGQSLRYEIPYVSKAYTDRRLSDFREYYAAIVRVGVTEETVDPVLLEILGDLTW